MLVMDLFYASLVWLKGNIKGVLVDNGWLKITKTTSLGEKEALVSSFTKEYPATKEIYRDLDVNSYKNKLEILEELERRLQMPVQKEPWPQPFNTLNEIVTGNSGYVKLGMVLL